MVAGLMSRDVAVVHVVRARVRDAGGDRQRAERGDGCERQAPGSRRSAARVVVLGEEDRFSPPWLVSFLLWACALEW
jgi:hypothetical protein